MVEASLSIFRFLSESLRTELPKDINTDVSFRLSDSKDRDFSRIDEPYRFSSAAQEYYSCYNLGSLPDQLSSEFQFLLDGEQIGKVPLTIVGNGTKITSNGEPILLPHFGSQIDGLLADELQTAFISAIIRTVREFNLAPPFFQEYENTANFETIEIFLRFGFSLLKTREVYVKNCEGELPMIWADIRKSYKVKINRGMRELEFGIGTGPKAVEQFTDFQNLHFTVAGRLTRSSATWQLQKEEVLRGHSFLSYILLNGEMIGCTLVPHTADHALYAVGAYRRDLLELNLGHVSQWRAIEQLNLMKIGSYRLGHLDITNNLSSSAKESSIAHFKRGFADVFFKENTYGKY